MSSNKTTLRERFDKKYPPGTFHLEEDRESVWGFIESEIAASEERVAKEWERKIKQGLLLKARVSSHFTIENDAYLIAASLLHSQGSEGEDNNTSHE